MMIILVLASACRASGALTIYRQFLSHIPKYTEGNKYYLFVDPSMDQPAIENVEYILDNNHSYKHRMYMDKEGYMKEMKERGVTPDVVFSLQNTGCVTDCRQVIYYHQSLPFYPQKWNPLKKAERTMFLYKYIYPFFVKRTLNKDTEVIVQIPFIKDGFVKRFNYDSNKVHVAFPDVENIDINNIASHDFGNECYNFIYPASPFPYKRHLTIVKALEEIRRSNETMAKQIRVHFTTDLKAYPALYKYIMKTNLSHCLVFHGTLAHEKLLSFYKGSTGLLFPSTIETLGLPLLEAAKFGLPIVAADLSYAHEVTNGYEGIEFVNPDKYVEWADKILNLCINNPKYSSMMEKKSDWDKIFNIILGG